MGGRGRREDDEIENGSRSVGGTEGKYLLLPGIIKEQQINGGGGAKKGPMPQLLSALAFAARSKSCDPYIHSYLHTDMQSICDVGRDTDR